MAICRIIPLLSCSQRGVYARCIGMDGLRKDVVVEVDTPIFSCSNVSRHFVKRLKEFGNGIVYANAVKRRFSKASFATDTDTEIILACDCVDSNHADVKCMTYLVDDLAEGGFSISTVVANKRYDAEYVHAKIKKRFHARMMIPLVEMAKPSKWNSTNKAGGFNRELIRRHFDKRTYNRRPQIETVNSMVKRKMGDVVYRRSGPPSEGVLFRCTAHNVRRLIDLGYSL